MFIPLYSHINPRYLHMFQAEPVEDRTLDWTVNDLFQEYYVDPSGVDRVYFNLGEDRDRPFNRNTVSFRGDASHCIDVHARLAYDSAENNVQFRGKFKYVENDGNKNTISVRPELSLSNFESWGNENDVDVEGLGLNSKVKLSGRLNKATVHGQNQAFDLSIHGINSRNFINLSETDNSQRASKIEFAEDTYELYSEINLGTKNKADTIDFTQEGRANTIKKNVTRIQAAHATDLAIVDKDVTFKVNHPNGEVTGYDPSSGHTIYFSNNIQDMKIRIGNQKTTLRAIRKGR